MTNFQLLSSTELKVTCLCRHTGEGGNTAPTHSPPPEFDHWTVQPVVSHYTIYGTRTALKLILLTSSTTD